MWQLAVEDLEEAGFELRGQGREDVAEERQVVEEAGVDGAGVVLSRSARRAWRSLRSAR